MIPRVIHYCWFGGKPLPKSVRKCIASWKKFLPDYEIREWNERNFDVNAIPYTAETYAAGKYAFVSDYARFCVMYEHGGVYFDTDVEIIRPLDDILADGAFFAMEGKTLPDQKEYYVAPGLGCACEPGNPVWREIIAEYQSIEHFDYAAQGTVCAIITRVLTRMGVALRGELVKTGELSIYPPDYFCPKVMPGAPICITANTRSIHHCACTWHPWTWRLYNHLMGLLPYGLQQWIRHLRHRS